MPQVALDTPLYEVLGAKSAFLKRLQNLGVKNVRDLLWHFPARYEDFSKIYDIAELEPGQQATIRGLIEDVRAGQSWRKHMSIVEATIADTSGSIRAVWFNQPYVANILKKGRQANFAGKISLSDEGEVYMSHPAYEVVRVSSHGGEETRHTARLVPVYPETRGLTSRGIRFIMQSVLKHAPVIKEWIPDEILTRLDLPEVNEALRMIHFPHVLQDAAAAQKRFQFEDLFLLQLTNLQQKLKLAQEHAPVIHADIERIKAVLAELPFALTDSQKRSLWEIIKDLERPQPMNRLLQGDVGSGKTVVAAIAAMVTSDNGLQAAFMAPTEILARQHFETMKAFLAKVAPPHQPVIGLLTGSGATILYDNDVSASVTKPQMAKKVAAGEVAIVFGTHVLIEKSVSFKELGLVIVDEQHRFGVKQRAELALKKNGLVPHFLSMSATPIPRTLMLTVFGDLDLSLITELPGGRKPVATKIVVPTSRTATYQFVRSEVQAGRQVFVICPRIEPTEAETASASTALAAARTLELRSVKEEFERLSKKVFPDLRVAMLHGQLKAKEKEEIMRKFKAREYDILVSTSVVEVGVDVPNATIMLIEGAERFGLAQLYQFRGRVGRSEHQSYCFLMADSPADAANARLRAILEAKNGFELAEKDLALRGPGQFFGEVQTGLPDVAMSALQDPVLVKESREAAIEIVKIDPILKAHPALKTKLAEFRKRVHLE